MKKTVDDKAHGYSVLFNHINSNSSGNVKFENRHNKDNAACLELKVTVLNLTKYKAINLNTCLATTIGSYGECY
jgi:hypothetical protein